jgi:hypothetical protein
MDVTVR